MLHQLEVSQKPEPVSDNPLTLKRMGNLIGRCPFGDKDEFSLRKEVLMGVKPVEIKSDSKTTQDKEEGEDKS